MLNYIDRVSVYNLNIIFFALIHVGVGVVQGWAAIAIGLCSGSIPWFTMMVVHKKSELLQKVDDTMAVFHTHAVAGCLGGLLTGLFAHPRLCYLFYGYYNNYYGLFYGLHDGQAHKGLRQMGLQLIGILFIVVVNVVMTSLICLLVQLIVPLRMSEEDMEIGDEAAHGEEAYAIWGQGDRLEKSAGFSDTAAGAAKSSYNTSRSQVEMV